MPFHPGMEKQRKKKHEEKHIKTNKQNCPAHPTSSLFSFFFFLNSCCVTLTDTNGRFLTMLLFVVFVCHVFFFSITFLVFDGDKTTNGHKTVQFMQLTLQWRRVFQTMERITTKMYLKLKCYQK